MDQRKMRPGYAETASRKNPREPLLTIVGESEIAAAKYIGKTVHDGDQWHTWKIPGKKRYYFQVYLGD